MRREKTQISKIRNANIEITTHTMEIQEIIRDYFEILYSKKFKNLEDIYRFLDTYDHPNMNQENINHLNRSITQNEIEAAIVSQKRKVQDQMDSLMNSIRLKELIPTLFKLFHEIEREGILPNSFFKPVLYSSENQANTPLKRKTIGQSP
jgi:plasmid rolling circle replication initiator protein Rep